ncbi:hypothetical protein Tco_0091282 [Tanacetum coccineum]
METHKPLLKDADSEDLDKHMYRSMIGSLMYLTSSRPDIMFVVCVCAGLQVNPKVSHLHVMKRIFRYLKGQAKLGLWYPKDSPFDLVAYTNSDYAGEQSLDRRATNNEVSILGCNIDFMACKKQDCEDSNEKKQIQMIKIHTDKNVADLLITAFDDVKTVNGEVQLQALVDGKKIIIIESTIRRDLQLEDAEGIDCLPNVAIFEQLTLMGYEKLSQKLTFYKAFFSPQWKFLIHTILQCLSAKTTAWNEFSSTMASAIICLATNQKFNFSKYIFDSMVKNVDNVNKFLMYPRFVQMFMNQQAGDMSNHKRIYVTPSHTKKVFGNMKREGKGFSGRVTPLFPTMMVQAQQEQGEGLGNPTDPQHTPTIDQPSSSQPQKKHKPRKPKKKDTQIPQSSVPSDNIVDEAINEENVPTHSNDPLLSGEDRLKLKELMALCTNRLPIRVFLMMKKCLQDMIWLKKEVSTVDPVTTVGEVVTTAKESLMRNCSRSRKRTLLALPTEATLTYLLPFTLAQTLTELKSARPKTKGVVMQELSETTTTIPSKDKGKGIMVEEPLKMKKKDQVLFDEQEAIRLQAQFDEEDMRSRKKKKPIVPKWAQWNDIQDKLETDYD